MNQESFHCLLKELVENLETFLFQMKISFPAWFQKLDFNYELSLNQKVSIEVDQSINSQEILNALNVIYIYHISWQLNVHTITKLNNLIKQLKSNCVSN
jgi:hypothetical protein